LYSGATSAAKAFFEIKTFTVCKSRYDHNNTTLRLVDGHANEVILSYDQKFKKLDHLFAADAVGDGTSDIVGPFEAAMSQKPILEPDTNSRTRGFATQIS
jgi:hypothetical protein